MSIPAFPKTTIGLRRGDYWAVCRRDKLFGFLVFLNQTAYGRVALIVAVLECIQNVPIIEPQGPIIRLNRVGLTHVKTFRETNSQICGNILSRLDAEEVSEALKKQSVTSEVWGYLLPVKLVNDLEKIPLT